MAIVVLIPGPLGRRLNGLRRRLRADGGAGLPAHIPLVGPFRAEPSFLPLEQHLQAVCHETAPFEAQLGPLAIDEEQLLIYADVASGRGSLRALREALLTGRYAPPRDDAPYLPRAVLGRLERQEDIGFAREEMVVVAAGAPFFVQRVDLMARYPDGAWYERDFFTLDRTVSLA